MQQQEFRQVLMTANGTADLMSTDALSGFASQLQTAPLNGIYQIRIVATTTGVQFQIFCGPGAAVPTSQCPGGGTIGVFPSETNSAPIQFACLAGDIISVQLRETAAGTPSVMAVVEFVG